jgi:hypothetical protein
MTQTRLADTLNAQEGTAFITINGSNRQLFEVSSVKAQIDYTVITKRMLGNRMTQHKIVGMEGSGSMTMYFANSQFLKLAQSYLKDGKHANISLQLRNVDPQSTIGAQEVDLYNIILNTIPVASLDDNSDDPITFDTDFTFDGISVKEEFVLPQNFRQ